MAESALVRAIGLISGTSMDGIDVSFVETDGETRIVRGAGRTMPYPDDLKRDLLAVLADPTIAERDPLTDLERRVTLAFSAALGGFLDSEGIHRSKVDLVGLHGQTVFHRPERRFTRQLGDGRLMAEVVGVPVVNDFRQADVRSGGHGAPFAPLYHAALAADLPKPLMVLNLGGVGNVTYVGASEILAFDTGPASALIDDLVRRRFGREYDDGGRIAAQGTIDSGVLARLLDNPFFAEKPPKSLDRQDFHARAGVVEALGDHDAVATLTAFTVEATALALEHVPVRPLRWLVGGGGRRNQSLMAGLAARVGTPVDPVEVVGWDGDQLESQLFAWLAVRSTKGLPLSLPTTTGVPAPMPGGVLWRP
jgi:anhydro-N-acetylmuramic acid kinase